MAYEIGEKIANTIQKELDCKAEEYSTYLDGKGFQFTIKINDKSFSVDLWDESIIDSFNK